jgi:hypothetical protein
MSTALRIQEDQLLVEVEDLLINGTIKGKLDLIDKVCGVEEYGN